MFNVETGSNKAEQTAEIQSDELVDRCGRRLGMGHQRRHVPGLDDCHGDVG